MTFYTNQYLILLVRNLQITRKSVTKQPGYKSSAIQFDDRHLFQHVKTNEITFAFLVITFSCKNENLDIRTHIRVSK